MTLTETWTPQAPPLRVDENGTVRIGKSRVTLVTILNYYRQGMTAEDLASAFDTVALAEIHAVISYYLTNRGVVDAYLAEKEREGIEIQKEIEARQGPGVTKEMLLQRRRERAGRSE